MVDSNIENGSSIAGGFVWKLGERFLAQGITFIVSIILARLLSNRLYCFSIYYICRCLCI